MTGQYPPSKRSDLLLAVQRTIDKYEMIPYDATVVVGLSGGVDSVTLLDLMLRISKKRNLHVVAVHVDHSSRESSIHDARFVLDLCSGLKVPLLSYKVDWADYCGDCRSFEQMAREVRYEFFEKAVSSFNSHRVALGHHKDDRLEWMLLRMLQGVPTDGWRIPPVRDKFVRPLYNLNRSQIHDYAVSRKLKWVEDPTNKDPICFRNKVRNQLLPFIEKMVQIPIRDNLIRMEEDLQEDAQYLSKIANEVYRSRAQVNQLRVDLKLEGSILRRVLYTWLVNMGIEPKRVHVKRILEYVRTNSSSPLTIGKKKIVQEEDLQEDLTMWIRVEE